MHPERSTGRGDATIRRDGSALLWLGCVALFLWAGCRDHRSIEEIEQVLEALGEEADRDKLDDPLEAEHARVRRIFVSRSSGLVTTHEVDVARGARRELLIELEEGGCYTWVATALPQSVDIDLTLTAPSGRVVASDRSPDHFPVLQNVCADEAGAHVLRILTLTGTGRAMVSVHRIFDDAMLDAAERLSELAGRYLTDARPVGPVHSTTIMRDGTHEVPFAVIPGVCYGFFVVSGTGVEELDAALIGATSARPLRDIGTDASPAIPRYCPQVGGTVRLRISMYRGEGAVFWQVFEH